MTRAANLAIVCERCLHNVDVLWRQRSMTRRSWLLHLSCHNEERLVEIDELALDQLDSVTWGQLRDVGDDADLERMFQSEEAYLLETAERIAAIQSVLRSRRSRT